MTVKLRSRLHRRRCKPVSGRTTRDGQFFSAATRCDWNRGPLRGVLGGRNRPDEVGADRAVDGQQAVGACAQSVQRFGWNRSQLCSQLSKAAQAAELSANSAPRSPARIAAGPQLHFLSLEFSENVSFVLHSTG